MEQYRNFLHNSARGVVPTFTGFSDANPADLANATDGDPDTFTSTATKILASSGEMGTLIFDLGRSSRWLIFLKVGLWSSAGSVQVYIKSNEQSVYERVMGSVTSASELKPVCLSPILVGQVVTLQAYGTAASTANFRLYEFAAYEVSS